jgi:hypothetical protein
VIHKRPLRPIDPVRGTTSVACTSISPITMPGSVPHC